MNPSPTPLIQIQNPWKNINPRHFFIKDESANPYGTVKDRRNYQIIQEANRLKVDKLVLITSGNNGYSLCKYANGSGIKVVCFISKNLDGSVKQILKKTAYQLIELNLDHKILRPEELIAFARETDDEVIWDVTNGYENFYTGIVSETLEQTNPDYMIVPVGSGGIFVALAEEFQRMGSKTKVIGVGVQNTIHSFADKLSTPWTPYAKAMEVYQKFGHLIYRLSEDEVKNCFKLFQNVIKCEPSSSAVFSVLTKHKFSPNDNLVFLNTGAIKTN